MPEKENKSDANFDNLLTGKRFIVIVLGVLFTNIGMVIIFTRPPFTNWFLSTGGVADTINGLTAPLFSLLGTYLIYISFRQQMIINKQQLENQALINKQQSENLQNEIKRTTAQSDFNTYYDIFKNIRNEIDSWQYPSLKGGRDRLKGGKDGLIEFCVDLNNYLRQQIDHYIKTVDEVNYFTETLLTVVLKVRNSSNIDFESHSLLVTLIITFYSKKMEKELEDIKESIERIEARNADESLSITLLKTNINLLHSEIVDARNNIIEVRKKQFQSGF